MIFYVLIFSLAAVVFNLTLPLMAGLYIVSDLGGSSYMSSYAVTFFCLGNIIGVPLGKPKVTRLSPIQLHIVCLYFMMLFSLGCGLASDYFNFILFRFLEGIASGPLYLLITFTLIPSLAPEKDKGYITSLLLICYTLGPVLAASWGGWIAFYHDWRMLFFSHIAFCIFLIIYIKYVFRRYHQKQAHELEFDKLGYGFYALSVTFIGTALTTGQELDWLRSPLFVLLISLGGLSCLLFLWRCGLSTYPIIRFGLLKKLYFFLAMLNVGLLFAIYFGMVFLLSLWLKLDVNYTPNWIILLIVTMGLGSLIPILIHYKSYDPRYPLLLALIFLTVSCFYATQFNVQIDFGRIAFSRVLAGIGLAFFLAPLFRLSTQSFPTNKLHECLNLFHIARLTGSGIGPAFFVILWHRRQVFYHERLGSHLTEFSSQSQQFFDQAQQYHLQGQQALARLNYYLDRQANVLALDDCFYLMGWLLLCLLLILIGSFFFPGPVLFDQKKNGKPEEPQDPDFVATL